MHTTDIVVVGGGPAGVAAAKAAVANGASVTLIDSAPLLGGQYGRQSIDSAYVGIPGAQHLANTVVWAIEPGKRLHLRSGPLDAPGRAAAVLDAKILILATGAYDRAIPFPGWDLPGVYTAGAAQALAKSQRLAVGKRVLVAGTGPFLLPVAESLVDVGSQVLGVLEANSPTRWLRGAFAGRSKLPELTRYAAMLAKNRIPYRPMRTIIAAHGTERVTSATTAKLDRDWNIVPGSEQRVEVDAVCVGFGFVPQLDLAVAAGCRVRDGFVEVDHAQQTSVTGVFAAGEITGIGGADLAAAEGEIAGTVAAGGQVHSRRSVHKGRTFARALAKAHPVRPGWRTWLTPDTIICRCESVGYGALRRAVEQRQPADLRTLKLVSRVGLGRCQGRMCGRAVAELTGIPEAVRRPIAAPVRLGELAEEDPA
ncbi:NAD(P)/FAD-dependent oxidoreductase [Allokutzneria sp. A3M-2-11 16]|uniref:NAD(P)/FAD-dependent oxidoreductase n=1 Tax=Allokutzneria sp. A3M-2-11 16 TaxID=2962043 RepID=UPI0020B89C02|nr:FAD/NAD(P)-binding oxidoreductase [Allokutzneria sp. A3M-2-11 16]MCP3798199.1 NAD(P)/FAD-dependent oxidoreductase [Allokutzneria sp. A3M-2-11 16]